MNFIGLRITPEFFVNKEGVSVWTGIEPFIDSLLKLVNPANVIKYIVADEKIDKKGRETHAHYHINICIRENYDLDKRKESIQRFIRRMGASGNKAYCVQTFADLDDEMRWFRYCCKEKYIMPYGFNKLQLDEMELLAKDERERTIASNLKTEDEMLLKNQFRDKLFKHLTALHETEISKKELFCDIGRFYQSSGKSPPFNKMMDIVLDYKVTRGWLSFEDYYDQHYNAFHKL